MLKQAEWVKLVYNETPSKANIKQGYLYDEGEFYKVVGDNTETLVRKSNVIAITKRKLQNPTPGYSIASKFSQKVMRT
jgi:hypothetical protein